MADSDGAVHAPDFLHKPVLDGERVRLQPVTVDDVPYLQRMLRDPGIRRLTGSRGGDGLDERLLRAWYGTRGQCDDRLDLTVVERATGKVAGEAVLNEWDALNESCNFRICLLPGMHERGLGTEATRLLVGHGFEKLGLHRIALEVYAFNPRARRVYEKTGFVTEGVRREALLWEGERTDAVVMAILAPEWFRHHGRILEG